MQLLSVGILATGSSGLAGVIDSVSIMRELNMSGFTVAGSVFHIFMSSVINCSPWTNSGDSGHLLSKNGNIEKISPTLSGLKNSGGKMIVTQGISKAGRTLTMPHNGPSTSSTK